MRASFRSLSLAALLVFAPAVAHAGASPNVGASATGGPRGSVLAIPGVALGGLLARFSLPFTAEPVLVDSRRLAREDGWTTCGYAVNAPAMALHLELTGRVQFDRAEIVFEDGTMASVDLRGAIRSNGMFELAKYENATPVMGVRVRARAASARAQIALRVEH